MIVRAVHVDGQTTSFEGVTSWELTDDGYFIARRDTWGHESSVRIINAARVDVIAVDDEPVHP